MIQEVLRYETLSRIPNHIFRLDVKMSEWRTHKDVRTGIAMNDSKSRTGLLVSLQHDQYFSPS